MDSECVFSLYCMADSKGLLDRRSTPFCLHKQLGDKLALASNCRCTGCDARSMKSSWRRAHEQHASGSKGWVRAV